MIDFKSYYSGSSGNLYSISDGKTTLMIDCGVPWKKIQKAFGFQTSKISALLLDHEHKDHSKAVKEVARAGIDVYLSKGTMEAIGVSGHRFHVIEAGNQFNVSTWSVLPFRAIHDAVEPLGFLLASGGDKAIVASDTHYIPYRFLGLNLIAIECNYDAEILKRNIRNGLVDVEVGKRVLTNHMSLATVKDFLSVNDLSRVREIHLLHLSDINSNGERFKKEIMQITGTPVYVADE